MKKMMLLALVIASGLLVGCGKETVTYLECTSEVGNITLYYNETTVYDYTVEDATYDISVGQERIDEYGLEEYLTRFQAWFEETGTVEGVSTGVCEKKTEER